MFGQPPFRDLLNDEFEESNDSPIIWYLNEDCLTAYPYPGFNLVIAESTSTGFDYVLISPSVMIPCQEVDLCKHVAEGLLEEFKSLQV